MHAAAVAAAAAAAAMANSFASRSSLALLLAKLALACADFAAMPLERADVRARGTVHGQ